MLIGDCGGVESSDEGGEGTRAGRRFAVVRRAGAAGSEGVIAWPPRVLERVAGRDMLWQVGYAST
jgi:hypothetical protein